MKNTLLSGALAVGILALAAVGGGCGTGQPAGNAAYGASADLTSVPSKTMVNGRKVSLRSMPGGLRYYDIKVGKGAQPKIGQMVLVKYYGALLNGTVFDASEKHGGQPIAFPIGVGRVIPGWDEGVPSMKVGGKRRLVIPGNLAYGPNSPSALIPPNATLVFDIVLVGIK
jgi:peptidylprolyl isomerase